ncbi:MAG: hypothetical protein CVT82_00285 [Alphaproteobacteria bacterium HGW-Alphaproteobacteria-4]|nr:MAG: hypothetical protein CVT82_00285 [Alphaproteobacteria bacterium HGW-Alphaproteobacteria-4]
MSQNDFVVADQTFPSILADFNAAFQALASASAGAAAPGTTYPYQLWADTTNNLLMMRNGANTAWLTLAKFDTVNNRWEVRSDVVQALSTGGVTVRNSAGTALATFSDSGITLFTGTWRVKNAAGTETLIEGFADGGIYLKYNNSSKAWTTNTGLTVSGTLTADLINGAALASQAEAEAGTDNTKITTPLRVAQAIAALAPAATTLADIAAATAGAVGTLAFARRTTGTTDVTFGTTLAGSSLSPVSAAATVSSASGVVTASLATGTALSGTWRCLGNYDHTVTAGPDGSGNFVTLGGATLWVRIS